MGVRDDIKMVWVRFENPSGPNYTTTLDPEHYSLANSRGEFVYKSRSSWLCSYGRYAICWNEFIRIFYMGVWWKWRQFWVQCQITIFMIKIIKHKIVLFLVCLKCNEKIFNLLLVFVIKYKYLLLTLKKKILD